MNIVQVLQDDLISPMIRKTAYGLATTCILGGAVYLGYRVATPEHHHTKQHRHPELNDQVSSLTYYRNKFLSLQLYSLTNCIDSFQK